MKVRLALVILILAASQAQASKVKICRRMATEAGETQQARKTMQDVGILYTSESYFKAREELYKRKMDKAPDDQKADMEKAIATARGMDTFIATEVFKYPSVMPPTFAADQVHAACMRLGDDELITLLKLR